MNAGLTWKMRLRGCIQLWTAYDSTAELDLRNLTEVTLSRDGYALHPNVSRSHDAGRTETGAGAVNDPALLTFPPRRNIVLSVDTDLCYRRLVAFPRGSEATLAETLRLDLLRVTPFDPASIIMAHRSRDGPLDGASRRVEQLVFKSQSLEPLRRALASRKLQLEAIVFRDIDHALWPIALSPNGKPYGIERQARWLKALMVSLLAICAAGMLSVVAASRQTERQEQLITGAISALKPRVDRVLASVDETKSSSAALRELADWKQGSLHLPLLIEEISRLLPDDAFLEAMTVDGSAIVIEGQSATPETLIATLEASPFDLWRCLCSSRLSQPR